MNPTPEYQVFGEGEDTLLFLHGLGGDWTNWRPQLDEFSDRFRCIAWTSPGYGASPPLEILNWTTLANAAVGVLNAEEIDAAIVVGLSMGGYVAQQMAADHADRVARLVLVATSSAFGGRDADFKKQYLASRLAPLDDGRTPADLAPDVVEMLLGPEPDVRARANCIASMSNITADAYRRALECLITWDFDDRLGEISAPTLCVAGSDDRTAPVKSLSRLASRIPDARLEVVERCGHLVNLDRPDEFNALLGTFVDQ